MDNVMDHSIVKSTQTLFANKNTKMQQKSTRVAGVFQPACEYIADGLENWGLSIKLGVQKI